MAVIKHRVVGRLIFIHSLDNLKQMASRTAKSALFDAFASVAQAVANGRRAEIVDVLAQGERSVDELAREIEQSVANTSHHLQLLAKAGVVRSRRDGARIHYRLASERVVDLWAAVRDVAEHHLAEVHVVAHDYLGERDDVEQLSPAELEERLARGQVVLLDVRPKREYEAGHIPGAVWAPLSDLEDVAASVPKRKEVVAYCRGPYCIYADDAVRHLQKRGLKARRLSVGLPEWRRAGHPTESAA
jgi:rhodanese-related sulfurtransferase/predicted transcriptional regulator